MNKVVLFLLCIAFCIGGCASEFETVRKSADTELKIQKSIEYYNNGEWFRAQTLINQLLTLLRGRTELEDLYYKYAYTHYNLNQYIMSSFYFRDFYNKFPNNPNAPDALFMAAYSKYKMTPSFRLDQTSTIEAIDGFQFFANMYPLSDRVEECNRLIDELRAILEQKSFAQGELYYQIREYQAASHSFENMLRDFPDTDRAEQIRYLMVKTHFEFARNSIETRKVERFTEALERSDDFLQLHQGSRHTREIESIKQQSLIEINHFKS